MVRPTDRGTSSALQGGAEEVAVGEEAEWCCLTVSQIPWRGPCPGPAEDGPGKKSAGEAPRVEGQGEAPPGQSVEEQVEAE